MADVYLLPNRIVRALIRNVFVPVFFGCCAVACLPAGRVSAELPTDIKADRYRLSAERLKSEKDYRGALKALDDLAALHRRHALAMPDTFYFKHAKVALSADSHSLAIDLANHYLKVAGKAGKFYKEALKLLDDAKRAVPEMVVIRSGHFWMGCSSKKDCKDGERPVHEVTINSFEMSKYEVTFEQYDRFVAATGHARPGDNGWGRGRRPVIRVSWEDAVAYTRWLSWVSGDCYRLPTEAEWEYAARADTATKYSCGNETGGNDSNCKGYSGPWNAARTVPVGSFEPNARDLYDMYGNVSEWVQDCWNDTYEGAPTDGSAWESGDCSRRTLRGGWWGGGPRLLRSAKSSGKSTENRGSDTGFRVVRTLKR